MNAERAVAQGSHEADCSEHAPKIVSIDDSRGGEWNSFVASAQAGSIYHRYEFRRLIAATFGHESRYFAAYDEKGCISGVLPLVRLRSRLFGDFMVSMPYFNYGGVLARSKIVANALLECAASDARGIGVSHVELRHSAPICATWPQRTDKVTMLLRLPPSIDVLNKQLGSKLRSQIKRPSREGAVAVSGGAELLDEFYAVFARNMRDLGTPVYPRSFFAAILATFPTESRLFIVRLNGRPVAAGLVIGHRGRLEIPWASSLREANAIGVNMLLYWHVLEYACEQKFEVFDFGRSTIDAGTYKFKKQWGAEPHQLYWHYWMREGGTPPMINPANPKYRLAVAAWQRLPVPVANVVGPWIVRSLP